MISCPVSVLLFWYINSAMQGSLLTFANFLMQQGIWHTLYDIWAPVFFGTKPAWKIILTFMATQLLLMRIVPAKTVTGPLTPKGNTPVYKDNGFRCFVITLLLFFAGSYFSLFSPTVVYDNFAGILGALNLFSLCFCLMLYLKGRFFPSSTDNSTTGNIVFDYYWGTELYPRVFGWDIKQFTNCRFGMMGWPVIILSFAAKQVQLYGSLSNAMGVCVAIMLVYIAKFFWWESGYLRSMDIMHDRAGFYICWGCLVWVPGVYTMPAAYLVQHTLNFPAIVALAILLLGILSVMLNYFADAQRQKVRATNGHCNVWGKAPKLIRARYTTQLGEEKESLLLVSGWWGISRHFHYILEISLAFFWTLPALFVNFLPWFYVIFLTILLTHRAHRDEKRCSEKYGAYWKEYCKAVPNKIIPFG